MSKHFNIPERLHILEEYLGSDLSKYAIEKKYGLNRGSIYHWLRKFGLSDKPKAEVMKTRTSDNMLNMSEQEELARLRKENRQLKAKLKHEEPGHKAYKLLVELAEETYGIEIRKNSEAK